MPRRWWRKWRRRGGRREKSARVTDGAGESHFDETSGGGEVEVGLAPNGPELAEVCHRGGQPCHQIMGLHDANAGPWPSNWGSSSQARGTSGDKTMHVCSSMQVKHIILLHFIFL